MPTPILVWLLTTISAGLAAYLGAYLRQKGQNLATHEDIQKLVEQVTATTQATKAIENRISDEFWNKQRVWEMKREALNRILASFAKLREANTELNVRTSMWSGVTKGGPEEAQIGGYVRDTLGKWALAFDELNLRRTEILILCSPEVCSLVEDFSSKVLHYFNLAKDGKIADYREMGRALRAIETPLYSAIRRELGIPEAIGG